MSAATASKPKPVINVADIDLQPRPPQMRPTGAAADKYDARLGLVGPRLGMRKLGCNVTAVAPGKRAFPFHSHRVNEELFFVLQGEGELRYGDTVHTVRAGDLVACPPGGKETAHQFVNTGAEELRYLAISTVEEPDVCEYPDSGKVGVLGAGMRFLGREDAQPGYWDGE